MTTLDLHNRTRQPHPTKGATGMRISRLSPAEREVVARVVDDAPPLRPALVAEIASLIGAR